MSQTTTSYLEITHKNRYNNCRSISLSTFYQNRIPEEMKMSTFNCQLNVRLCYFRVESKDGTEIEVRRYLY